VEQTKFLEEYKRLNPGQKAAVDTINGPVMVFAGPGTGKTRVLTLRIANIIRTGAAKADEILAITFTEAGAFTMRRRLMDLIGAEGARVNIHTFHGFCNRVIQEFPLSFPHIVGSVAATEGDAVSILRQVLDEGDFLSIRPRKSPYHYLSALQSAIGTLKREGVRPLQYKDVAKEAIRKAQKLVNEAQSGLKKEQTEAQRELSKAQKNFDLALAYEAYEEKKKAESFYDYSDMILEVAEAMAVDKNLRGELQERFQFILVDEHQDTNDAQNRILDLLTEDVEQPNLFVVGDDMQAIYRFQGASVENFLHLKRRYPNAQAISISENYRSHQTILDYAHRLAVENEVPRARLTAKGEIPASPVRIIRASDPQEEKAWVVKEIKRFIEAGVPAEEVALLYRTNEEGREWAGILEHSGLPVSLESASQLFADPDVLRLKRILLAAENPNDDGRLFSYLLQDILGCEPLDVFLALKTAQENRRSLWQTAMSSAHNPTNASKPENLRSAAAVLSKIVRTFESDGAQAGLQAAITETNLLPLLLSRPDALERAEKFSFLFDEAAAVDTLGTRLGRPLSALMKRLEILEEHKTARGGAHAARVGRVRLMTSHGSKGQEFRAVFITNVREGHWSGKRANPTKIDLLEMPEFPGVRGGDEAQRLDDEQRLFYVAATRAKEHLIMTYAAVNADGNEQTLTQFLLDLPEGLAVNESVLLSDEEKLAFEKQRLGGGEKNNSIGLRDPQYICELLDKRGISPTHLNSFLTCKWKYFFVNLLRVPQPVEPHLQFGTAIHGALQALYENDPRISKSEFVSVFEKQMDRAAIPDARKKDYIDYGKELLSLYYEQAKNTSAWNLPVLCEIKLDAVLPDGTKITGKLDKVELLPGGGGVVVDYKTGKPKTLNAILGKTKDESGPGIFRQAVFYRMLADMQKNSSWHFSGGRIEFIESLEDGKLISHNLDIKPEEVKEVEGQILQMAKEVRELSFWEDYHCEDKKCEYCALRRAMG
jgi:DNA helicase-2/ATP-dependent DNA helicase PcrA